MRGRIAIGFVESVFNQVIAKRFEKQQQMRWTPLGRTFCFRFACRS